MISVPQIETLIALAGKRGQALAAQVQALLLLDAGTASDLNSFLFAVLSFGQGYARAMTNALSWIMADAIFPTLGLRQQAVLADQAQLWEALFSGIGAVSYAKRLTTASVFSSNPSHQFSSAGDRGIAVSVALEQVIGAANRSGVSVALFWTSTPEARLVLSRLAIFDAVLEPSPTFDPLADALRMLREALPLSPDIGVLTQRLNKDQPTGTFTRKLPRALAYTVRQGDTLELIAQRTLGQASQWRELADFNALRSPYISDDPVYALGSLLLSLTLVAETVIGTLTLACSSAIGVQRGMRVRIVWNNQAQIVTVESANLTTNVVTVKEAITLAVPTTAEVSVYASEADTPGAVLTSGSTLLLPVPALARGGLALQAGTGPVIPARLYGTDLVERGENLVIENGDFALVSGWDNIKQALEHRFRVEVGSLAYHPEYGTGLLTYLGLKSTPYFHFLAGIETRQTVLRDPRIASVDNVSGTVEADTLSFDVLLTTAAFEQFPPLQITVVL